MSRSAALAFASLLVLAGCGGATNPTEEGSVQVTAAATAADVASIEVRITVASTSFDVTRTLVRSGTTWSGLISGIPAGLATFVATADDINGIALFTNTTTATITAGGTANVSMILQEIAPPNPFQNGAPYFTSIALSSATPPSAGAVTIHVRALDPDTDPMTFAFTADPASGSFGSIVLDPDLLGATVVYTAPSSASPLPVNIVARVSDTNGATSTASFTLTVTPPTTGSANISVTVNGAPAVNQIVVVVPSLFAVGDSATLTAMAVDPEGQPLTYAWSVAPGSATACSGTFTPANDASTVFQLASVDPAATVCTLLVTVTDAGTATNTGTIDLALGPHIVLDVGPQVLMTSITPDAVLPFDAGTDVTLSVSYFAATGPNTTGTSVIWDSPAFPLLAGTSLPDPLIPGALQEQATLTLPAVCPPGTAFTATATLDDGVNPPIVVPFAFSCI